MIEIANWVANFFLLGLGLIFSAIGLIVLLGLLAGIKDLFRRFIIPKSKEKSNVG